MFTKYILCILTIEWAVLGTWLLKGKGRSYERIQKNDEIREKDRFVRFQGMNLLYLALTAFLTLLTTFAGSDRLTILFFIAVCHSPGNTEVILLAVFRIMSVVLGTSMDSSNIRKSQCLDHLI